MNVTPVSTAPTVVIRPASGSDDAALDRLAQLDSSHVPAGNLLVAEADGRLVAALAADTGDAIADPFRPTADVLDLLQLRARLHRGARRRGVAGLRGTRLAPRARAA
jgi:hypothetical protein